jgi:hypothetical protein
MAVPSANAADKLDVCVGTICSTQNLPAGSARDIHETAKSLCFAALPNGLSTPAAAVCSYAPSFDSLAIVSTLGASAVTQPIDGDYRIGVGIGPGLVP